MRKTIGAAVAAGAVLGGFGPAVAEPQPHMEAALQALETAKHEIEIADEHRDHGGHAGEATELIERAIKQVREGIRFKDEHHR